MQVQEEEEEQKQEQEEEEEEEEQEEAEAEEETGAQEEGQCAKVARPRRDVVACKSAGAGAETATLAPPRRA